MIIDTIGWIASGLQFLGVIFNTKKSIWCWPFYILANLIWTIYGFMVHPVLIPFIVTTDIFIIIDIFGWLQWSKDKK